MEKPYGILPVGGLVDPPGGGGIGGKNCLELMIGITIIPHYSANNHRDRWNNQYRFSGR